MALGLLPKPPVSASLYDEVPHIFIPSSRLEPREILISSAKRLLQQYLPISDIVRLIWNERGRLGGGLEGVDALASACQLTSLLNSSGV